MFIVHFVNSQLRPGHHHCDEMNYELVIWRPGISNTNNPDIALLNLPKGDLRAEFHLDIINLINAPQHQIDFDVGRSV